MESIKVDFCTRCRRYIDWAIDNIPLKDIYIQANPNEKPSNGRYVILPLCKTCGKFVHSTLHIDGFTIYTP